VDGVPLALAVAAGMVAALNPCGFVLLPVYLTVLVVGADRPSTAVALGRAALGTAAIAVGFAGTFAVFGLALRPVAGAVQERLPWFTVGLGLMLVVLGGWLLAGRDLPGVARLAGRGPDVRRSALSMVAFGAAYALASLGCTVGPFLAIVVSSFRAGSPAAGVGLFLAYAAGMAVVVGAAAVAVALARTTAISRLRRLSPAISRAGGLVVALAGGYVSYYGWYELRIQRGGDPADPVVDAATTVQGWLADGIGRPAAAVAAATLVAALAAAALIRAARRRSAAAEPGTE
jgi:cytochrome c biogenesis protein CcdA